MSEPLPICKHDFAYMLYPGIDEVSYIVWENFELNADACWEFYFEGS